MSAISVDLAADESVVWTGRGDKLPWFAPADACIVPFTFLWAGGAGLAAVSAASKHPAQLPFAVLFVVVGVYISIGRLIVRRRHWRQPRYTVTSDRVLVTRGQASGVRLARPAAARPRSQATVQDFDGWNFVSHHANCG